MASEYYLYSSQTNEAVEVMRRGANGLNTPQGSSKAKFAFLSYHMGKNASFELTQLQSIGKREEDIQFVSSLNELSEQRELHAGSIPQVTLVLLWKDSNAEELLGREHKQLEAIKNYDFPQPNISGNPVQG